MNWTTPSLDCGFYIYQVKPIYMKPQTNLEVFQTVEHKIYSGKELDNEDIVSLAMTPIMGKGLGKKDAILKSLDYLKKYRTESAKRATAILYTFADKFLNLEDLNEVKEAVYMTKLGQLIKDDMEQEYERGIEQGSNYTRILFSFLMKDNRMDDMKKATEDEAYCQQLKKEYKIDER